MIYIVFCSLNYYSNTFVKQNHCFLLCMLLKLVVYLRVHECVALGQLLSARHFWLLGWSSSIALEFEKLDSLLLFSSLFQFLHVYLKFTLHKTTKCLYLGLEEVSFCLGILKLERIFEQTTCYQFILNNLYLPDQVSAACPARHSLVDLFLLVHHSELLFEILFVS